MSEHTEQAAFIEWASWNQTQYPDLRWLYAVPNGGKRHIAVAAKMKAEGVKAGVPDLCLPVPRGKYHGLYLETKIPGNDTTPEQDAWLQALANYGFACRVCYGFEALKEAVLAYLEHGL